MVSLQNMRDCDRSRLGHAWFDIDDTRPPREVWVGNTVVARCERCTTTRYYGINVYGEIESRHYAYPEGWSERWREYGGERPTTQDLRLMAVQKQREMRRARA